MDTEWRWKTQRGSGSASLDSTTEPLTLLASGKPVLSIAAAGTLEAAQFRGDGAQLTIAEKPLLEHLAGKLDLKTGGSITGPLQVRGNLTTALPGRVDVIGDNLARVVGLGGDKIAATLQVGDAVKINEQTYTVAAIDPEQRAFTLNQPLTAGESRTGVTVYTDTDLWVVQNGAGEAKLVVDKSGRVTATAFAGAVEARHLQGTLHEARVPALPMAKISGLEAALDGKLNIGAPQQKLDVRGQALVQQLIVADQAGQAYPENWIGMSANISGATKWLHIGGITDGEGAARKRRLALWADIIAASGNVGIGIADPGADRLKVQGNTSIVGTLQVSGAVTATGFSGPVNAADIAGTLPADRIPPLDVAKVTGLQQALAEKLGTRGGTIPYDLEVQGRFKAGWYEPTYDSGWIEDHNRTNHKTTCTHNLGYFPASCVIYFSPTKGDTTAERQRQTVYLLSWPWLNADSGNPVSIELTGNEVILHIYSGTPLHGVWNAVTAQWTRYTQGYWRVLVFGGRL